MKKYCFLFLSLIFFACNQNSDKKNVVPQEHPKEFFKTVEGVEFKMIKVKKVRKATLGKKSDKERVVTLSEFYIAETEVTQELYKAVTGKEPSHFNESKAITEGEVQSKRPVECVNWYEAALFCNALTEKLIGKQECVYTLEDIEEESGIITKAKVTWDFSKKGYRLPTEAEFEYAARGGDANVVFAGGNYTINDPTGKEYAIPPLKEVAWFNGNANHMTHEVAKKLANGYGIYDMSGNVMEWCNDYYVKPIPENVEKDPQGPDKDEGIHTCKGGGYGPGGYSQCVVSGRTPLISEARLDDVGFRMVCRL